jgi:TolB-like protein/Flp pilus assembly protein TadD
MSFFAELKQRKVVRVTLVYLLVAWVAIQAASIALPAFDAPAWTLRVVILLFALGLPLVLLLTWALELTPEGVRVAAAGPGGMRMAVIAAVVAGLALGWYFLPALRPGHKAVAQRSIAVLPFVNMSGDKANDYFSDGLAETTLAMLAQVPDLKVIARTSSFAFKGKPEDVREIGRQLDAANLLEGSVQQAGETLRITVQLVRTSDGSHLWSRHYDRPMKDLFKIQDEVAAAVVRALQSSLPGRQSLPQARTNNIAAYREYLKGIALQPGRKVPQMREAVAHFERAITLDPGYARAYIGAGDAYNLLDQYDSITAAERERAERYVQRALELAPQLGEAHVSNAARLEKLGDLDGAEREYKRGIELAPGYATGYQWYGELLMFRFGRVDEALPMFARAVALDPLSPIVSDMHASALIASGRYDEGLAENARLIAAHPEYAPAWETRAHAMESRGDLVGALQAYDRQIALDPEANERRFNRCNVLSFFDALPEARRCYADAIRRDPDSAAAANALTWIHVLDGDAAGALAAAQVSPSANPWNLTALLLANHQDAQALALVKRIEPGLLAQPPHTRSVWTFDRGLAGLALLRTGATAQGHAVLHDMLKINAGRAYGAALLDRSWWDALAYSWLDQAQPACAALQDAVAHGYFLGLDRLDHDPLAADLRALDCYQPTLQPARQRATAQIEAARAAGLFAREQQPRTR